MNYIDKIFERGEINLISKFLIDGALGECDPRPYIERIEVGEQQCVDLIEAKFQTRKEKDEMTDILLNHIGNVEAVYMEIGLQIGSKLAWQVFKNLMNNDERRK